MENIIDNSDKFVKGKYQTRYTRPILSTFLRLTLLEKYTTVKESYFQ